MLNLIRKANEVIAILSNENKARLANELNDAVDAMWRSKTKPLDERSIDFVTTVNGSLALLWGTEQPSIITNKLNDAVDKFWRSGK